MQAAAEVQVTTAEAAVDRAVLALAAASELKPAAEAALEAAAVNEADARSWNGEDKLILYSKGAFATPADG